MKRQELQAEVREIIGRKVKQLRREGILPGNIYGKDIPSQAVKVSLKEFEKVFTETGETGLIDLIVAGTKRPVLVHDIKRHPVSDMPLHVDFHQVNLKEEVTANVPVVLTGESPAEKQGIGTVVQVVNELEVTALPDQLPQEFIVDVSNLAEVGQSVAVSDLSYDKENVKINVENPEEMVLVKVDALVDVEAELAQPVEVAEGEAIEGEGQEAPEGEGEQVETEKAKEETSEQK